MTDSIEKRFCFDVVSDQQVTYTLQALSDEDRKLWLEAMEAISSTNKLSCNQAMVGNLTVNSPGIREEYVLDEFGLQFVKKLIEQIEAHGLDDQGIYRVSGVSSKIQRLMKLYADTHKNLLMNADSYTKDTGQGESALCSHKVISTICTLMDEFAGTELKNVTSALKNYLRNLPEPLMTFRLHSGFISAAKIENKEQRVNAVHELVHRLPKLNFAMVHILMKHLNQVAARSDKNLMNVCNIGVCFGPTLLRPEEESVAAIMNIKFCNVVVEILIENCEKIFTTKPPSGSENIGGNNSRLPNRHPSSSNSLLSNNLIQVPPNHGLPLSAPNINHSSSASFGVLNRPMSNSQTLSTLSNSNLLHHPTPTPPNYREVIRTNPRFTGYPPSAAVMQMSIPVPKPVTPFTVTSPNTVPYSAYTSSLSSLSLNPSTNSPESQKTSSVLTTIRSSTSATSCFVPLPYASATQMTASPTASITAQLSSHLGAPHSTQYSIGMPNNSHSSNFYVPFAQSSASTSCSAPSLNKLQPSTSSSPNSSSSSASVQLLQPPPSKLSGSLPSANAFTNSATPSVSSIGSLQASGRNVRTLYACVGKGSQELSFEANVIITNGNIFLFSYLQNYSY